MLFKNKTQRKNNYILYIITKHGMKFELSLTKLCKVKYFTSLVQKY